VNISARDGVKHSTYCGHGRGEYDGAAFGDSFDTGVDVTPLFFFFFFFFFNIYFGCGYRELDWGMD
jgi:hypothetical protein